MPCVNSNHSIYTYGDGICLLQKSRDAYQLNVEIGNEEGQTSIDRIARKVIYMRQVLIITQERKYKTGEGFIRNYYFKLEGN